MEFIARPYRFLIAAGVLAALLCLFPARVDEAPAQADAPEQDMAPGALEQEMKAPLLPARADLSERTGDACFLHRTLYYTPCGHSVQSRERLPARLTGLSRAALEKEIGGVIPGAAVTGFSAAEVDIAVSAEIPCPLHWVLASGDDGLLQVKQNVSGEALKTVRRTEIPLDAAPQEDRDALRKGRIFDDVQALEGYLESLSS